MTSADAPDARWLARAQAGDLYAFSQLVRLHQGRVRRQLLRLTRGDRPQADDLAQQTFLLAWRGLPAFRGDAQVGTWLYRIAYRCFLQAQRTAADAAAAREPMEACAEDPRRAQLMRIDVARALDRLPEHERVALIHCYQLDLSHDEAAQVLGLPLGTLKSQVARGKARLRELLAAWQPKETT